MKITFSTDAKTDISSLISVVERIRELNLTVRVKSKHWDEGIVGTITGIDDEGIEISRFSPNDGCEEFIPVKWECLNSIKVM